MSEFDNVEKEQINRGSYYQFQERLNINNENAPCDKCSQNNNNLIIYSCSHKLCFNCIFKYFLSSNFKGMSTFSIKAICPQCQKGDIEINLDDFIEILKLLLYQKHPNFEEENNVDDNKNFNFCKVHKDKKVIKYCKQCSIDLCEKCIREMHDRNFPNHKVININEKKINIKNNDRNSSFDNIRNNKEINELQQKETIFMQKIESEIIMLQTKLNNIINDINYLMQNFIHKITNFQNEMKKIFQIINLSYYNYYSSDISDKKEITISKKLIDFNIVSKKIELNEINKSMQKIIKDFNVENPIFNYELEWEGQEYKKNYTLFPKKDSDDKPDCITKIIEFRNGGLLISSLINGQIYVWNLFSKNIDYSINAHKSSIWSMIKLSNDYIVSGSSDKMIKIWDIINKKTEPNIKLKGHKGTIFCLGEIEKDKIISGSEDRTIRLWDLVKKECIKILEDPNGSKINCSYILSDPGFIITGGDDNLLKIWNIYSDYIPNTLVGHECTIWCITSVSDDDTIIASGSSDNAIKIWDLTSLKCLFTLEGHENTISSLKLLKNDLLVSASWDKTVKIWNLKTKNCFLSLEGHNNIVWDVIQLENGDLATCSSDKKIIVWSKSK